MTLRGCTIIRAWGFFAEEAHIVLMNHAPDTLLLGECSKPALHVALDEEVGRDFLLLVHHGLGADCNNMSEQRMGRGGAGEIGEGWFWNAEIFGARAGDSRQGSACMTRELATVRKGAVHGSELCPEGLGYMGLKFSPKIHLAQVQGQRGGRARPAPPPASRPGMPSARTASMSRRQHRPLTAESPRPSKAPHRHLSAVSPEIRSSSSTAHVHTHCAPHKDNRGCSGITLV
jgi:hypothetical protein